MKKTFSIILLTVFAVLNTNAIEFGDIEAQYPLYSVSDPFAIAVATNAYNKAMAETALRTSAIVAATNAVTAAYLAAISDEATGRINGDSANNAAIGVANANIANNSNRINTANANISVANANILNNSNRINVANANIAAADIRIAADSNRINTAFAHIANESNRVNTANVHIAANSNGLVAANANIAANSNGLSAANANISNTSNSVVALDAKLVATSNVLAQAIGEGGGITAPTATNISQAVLAPYTNRIVTAWQNPSSATNFTWTSDGSEITITGYNIAGGLSVIIPDMLDGLKVTKIGQYAFNSGEPDYIGKPITSLDAGKNIKQILYGAFNNCTALTSANLHNIELLDDSCFNGCDSLISITYSGNVPSFGNDVFTSPAPIGSTNFVTSSTATGWSTTFCGIPVVRMPIEAESATIGTVIKLSTNYTPSGSEPTGSFFYDAGLSSFVMKGTNKVEGLTLGGVTRSTWPDGGSSTPLAWTPITTRVGGTICTANVTTARSVYSFSTDVAVTLTNNLAAIPLNCTTNYDWQVWISMNTQAALSSIATNWDARIEWLGGAPDFSCTGLYKIAMSTACGTRIQARQIYPTIYPWKAAAKANARNTYTVGLAVGPVTMLNQVDTNAYCYIVRDDISAPALMRFHSSMTGSEAWNVTNRVYARIGLVNNNAAFLFPPDTTTIGLHTNAQYGVNHIYIPRLTWNQPSQGHGYVLQFYRTNALSSAQRVDLGEMQWMRTANELEQVAGTNKAAWATAYQ